MNPTQESKITENTEQKNQNNIETEDTTASQEPTQPSISILYEDDSILAIHKPPFLPFHQRGEEQGVMHALRTMAQKDPSLQWDTLHPAHRLDAVVSGIMLFAKSPEAARELGRVFSERIAQKYYVALAHRKPNKKQGRIMGDMQKSRRGSWKLTRGRENPAVTFFTSTSIPARRPGLRMYILQPKTGKTHQLRVAMKSLGSPILGDVMYAQSDAAKQEERTYLHACCIRFPFGTKTIEISCPPTYGEEFQTEEFTEAWESWLEEWKLETEEAKEK